MSLFSSLPPSKAKSSDKLQIASLKSNCSLFSRLYVSCQVRDGDLKTFFCHGDITFIVNVLFVCPAPLSKDVQETLSSLGAAKTQQCFIFSKTHHHKEKLFFSFFCVNCGYMYLCANTRYLLMPLSILHTLYCNFIEIEILHVGNAQLPSAVE